MTQEPSDVEIVAEAIRRERLKFYVGIPRYTKSRACVTCAIARKKRT